MAKKSKKSVEAQAAETENPAETIELKNAPETPAEPEVPETKSEMALDIEAEHRQQGESPAVPEDAEAEAEALAAETSEEALEGADIEAGLEDEDSDDESDDEEDDDADDEEEDEDESEEDEVDDGEEVTEDEDSDEPEEAADVDETTEDEVEEGFTPQPRPPAKLERLQKILAQAGVASRRRAEELIEQGRVQVNGKIVTELGTKADAGRDHIRVDGKLLHGAERLRYFVLNKPKGYVTTVKDPEHRSTVMEFFAKMPERLYPVGRLDYQSEGLLLVTNDGELANKLTKAASGVEKTYLVKVSGQPTESELDILRGGVSIERGKPGEGRVRTSPARVRQVRQGDNPWYEVVLIEGRNRELRKMFEEIGHFVEKIRRVGYGPLVLDQEPGNFRELQPEELTALRLAADGKLRTPKSKDVRRRNLADAGKLPTVLPKPTRPRPGQTFGDRPAGAGARPTGQFPPKRSFGTDGPSGDRDQAKPFRPARPAGEGYSSGPGRGAERPSDSGSERFGARRPAAGKFASGPARPSKFGSERPRPGSGESAGAGSDRTGSSRPGFGRPSSSPAKFGQGRPAWKKDDRPSRPPAQSGAAPSSDEGQGSYRGGQGGAGRASTGRDFGARGRTGGARTFGAKPAWNKSGGNDRPPFHRPSGPRRDAPLPPEEPLGERRPSRLKIEAVEPDTRTPSFPGKSSRPPRFEGRERSQTSRPGFDRPPTDRPRSDRPRTERPRQDRPQSDRPRFEGSDTRRTGGSGRPGGRPTDSVRPPRGDSGLARPFTSSSGVPRAGGARPSSKSGKPGGRSGSGARPAGKSGWKPKPSFGGKGKPPSGAKKSGPRPGGKRPGRD